MLIVENFDLQINFHNIAVVVAQPENSFSKDARDLGLLVVRRLLLNKVTMTEEEAFKMLYENKEEELGCNILMAKKGLAIKMVTLKNEEENKYIYTGWISDNKENNDDLKHLMKDIFQYHHFSFILPIPDEVNNHLYTVQISSRTAGNSFSDSLFVLKVFGKEDDSFVPFPLEQMVKNISLPMKKVFEKGIPQISILDFVSMSPLPVESRVGSWAEFGKDMRLSGFFYYKLCCVSAYKKDKDNALLVGLSYFKNSVLLSFSDGQVVQVSLLY